ncbi:MAG: hypothetical protein EOP38_06360 [Rubrivivax sp.]|nr:MAG: hypothetical protein EOP38_06360 [Rubrivivax sp.]
MIGRFAIVSGIGWTIDFSVFYGLCEAGAPVFIANLAGATLAVLFVFFMSLRPIFLYQGGRTSGKLVRYAAYQALAIPLASAVIDALDHLGTGPLWAKLLVTPFTFLCNFLFMRFIARSDSKAP